MKNSPLLQGAGFQAVGMFLAYGILCVLLGLLFFGGVGSAGAGRVAVFPWEVAMVVAGVVLVGALVLRRLPVRTAVELVLGVALFLGVWVFCWYAFGELGLAVAGIVTLAQAFYRKLFVHDFFVLIGVAGTTLYVAFLFPAVTWAVLFLGLAIYDTVGGRLKRVTSRFARSVIHRGVVPMLLLPPTPRGFLHPLIERVRSKESVSIGMAELLLPAVFVAHAALFGVAAFVVTAIAAMGVAAWCAWRRVEALLLPLALAVLIPYLLFAVFV